jgi:hypothetical protein
MSRRTGGLTAICVIALVVGVLSAFSSFSQFLSLLVGDKLQAAIAQVQPANNQGMQEIQQEMFAKTAAITRKYAVYHWISLAAQSILAGIMIVGAILTLQLKAAGRMLLLIALAGSLFFEPAKAALSAAVANEMMPITVEMMQQAAKAGPPGAKQPPGFEEMMGGMSRAIVVLQWAMLIGMTAAWCIFYLVGVWYLTKPAVKALFIPAAQSETETPGEPQWR